MGLFISYYPKILSTIWDTVNPFTLWAFPPYTTGTFPPSSTAFNSRQQLYNNKYNNIYNNISTMIEGTCSRYDMDIYKHTTIVNDVNPFPSEHVHAGTRSRRPPGTRSRWNSFPPEPVPGGVPEHVPAAPWELVPAGTRSRRAPVPAASPERVPGEHAPTGSIKAGGAGGTVVRTHGYLSFSRRCVRRGSACGSLGRNV